MSETKRALIFGCGPAGLIAAHALRSIQDIDWEIHIISQKAKSQLFGCQYLHEPIPGTETDHMGHAETIDYRLIGTAEEYAHKVYGENPPDIVSPQEFNGLHLGWDIRATYDELWSLYENRIVDHFIRPSDVMPMFEFYDPHFIISSIPPQALCFDLTHEFKNMKCWAVGDTPGSERAPRIAPNNTVICDGTKDHGYYRASNVFGYSTVEWPGTNKPPMDSAAEFIKPLSTTCTCYAGILRVGRMGTWTKGVLAHHVYRDVRNWIPAQMSRKGEGTDESNF